MPKCPINPTAYERLYEFNSGCEANFEVNGAWQEIRIRPAMSEETVLRMLPKAADFEYGGYLTKSRIRYHKCYPTKANVPLAKPVTFHSHPTNNNYADTPSVNDVYFFLYYRHLRTITVGAKFIWVWNKTKATLETVKNLRAWTDANMLVEMRRLSAKYPRTFSEDYMELALKNLGLVWPKKQSEWAKGWEAMLRDILKIEVFILPRFPNS